MTNKKKYSKEILDIACRGESLALRREDDTVCACCDIACKDCGFSTSVDEGGIKYCTTNCITWCNSEYIPKIDWDKVPINTPILCGDGKLPRHFAYYDSQTNLIHYYASGKSSYTSDVADEGVCTCSPCDAELMLTLDVEKYSK